MQRLSMLLTRLERLLTMAEPSVMPVEVGVDAFGWVREVGIVSRPPSEKNLDCCADIGGAQGFLSGETATGVPSKDLAALGSPGGPVVCAYPIRFFELVSSSAFPVQVGNRRRWEPSSSGCEAAEGDVVWLLPGATSSFGIASRVGVR